MASRPKRWQEAIDRATKALDTLVAQRDELTGALEDLASVQEEYQEWRDNLPENLDSSPLAEKLDEVIGLDIESAKSTAEDIGDEIRDLLDEAGNVDLPRGFGRD